MKAKNKKYNNKKLCKRANAAVTDVVRGFHINRRSAAPAAACNQLEHHTTNPVITNKYTNVRRLCIRPILFLFTVLGLIRSSSSFRDS